MLPRDIAIKARELSYFRRFSGEMAADVPLITSANRNNATRRTQSWHHASHHMRGGDFLKLLPRPMGVADSSKFGMPPNIV